MNRKQRVLATIALLWFTMGTAFGAQGQGGKQPPVEQPAMASLMRMADFMAQAGSLSVTADVGYDIVQDSGQKLEFGETLEISLIRPDRMRMDSVKRDGVTAGFIFDGREIMVFDEREKVYATAPKPGSLDAAITYFKDDLDMRLPLGELFRSDLPAFVKREVRTGDLVGEETLAGIACDHLAFRSKDVDYQLWIARNGDPLLVRLVVTYIEEEGQPQFWAQFRDWRISQNVADAVFAFNPPEGFEKIPLLAEETPARVPPAPADRPTGKAEQPPKAEQRTGGRK